MKSLKVVDGTDLVLGRVAALVAKELLNGEDVRVVNAEKLVLSGNPRYTVQKYAKRRDIQNKSKPEHSPHWPRRPDLLVKRVIRGMLPFRKARGREAFKKLRVYYGVPEEFKSTEALSFERMHKNKLSVKSISVMELCKHLGYRVG